MFRKSLLELMEKMSLNDEDVARLVGASRPSVERWKAGVTQPHPAMQEAILSLIRA
jgi:hypothetical protein